MYSYIAGLKWQPSMVDPQCSGYGPDARVYGTDVRVT